MMFSLLNLLLLLCVTSMAFSFSSIRPSFNHNRFSTVLLAKPSVNSESTNNIEKDQPQLKKGINLSNLLQLVLMGAGAPSLGEFDRMDENGKMFFKLEANNFVDSKVKLDDIYIMLAFITVLHVYSLINNSFTS